MYLIESSRLGLLPMTREDILQLISGNRKEVCIKYSLTPCELELDDDFNREIEESYGKIANDLIQNPDGFPWNTLWWIVHSTSATCIGGIGVTGPPWLNELIIGYYIDKRFEGVGYATEALNSMCEWIFRDEHSKRICAYTLPDGFASQKVLLRNGFINLGLENGVLKFEKAK